MEKITEKQITELGLKRNTVYKINDTCFGFNVGDYTYRTVTGIDLQTLSKIYGETHVYGEITYHNAEDGTEVHWQTMVNDTCVENLSGSVCADDDFLFLFKKNDELKITKDDVINYIKNHTEDRSEIFDSVDLTVDDIPDYVKDDLQGELVDNWFENAGSDDIYDKIPSGYEKDILKTIIDNIM